MTSWSSLKNRFFIICLARASTDAHEAGAPARLIWCSLASERFFGVGYLQDPLNGDVIDCYVMYNDDVTFENTCFVNIGQSEAKSYFQGLMEEQKEVLTEGVRP